jgi:hypothetical protein
MKQTLMLLAATAVAALAFTAIPAVALAGEFTADCEVGATCAATLTGGQAAVSTSAGETISCSSFTGTANFTSGSSTSTIALLAHGCRETVTFFRFACNSAGQPSGTIRMNELVGHNVYLESDHSITGILITNVNTTFECAGFSKKTVTGNILGATPNPQCGVFKSSASGTLEATAHGSQKYTQVTTAGTVFDLIISSHEGAYQTLALIGSLTATVSGNKIKATC